MRLEGVWKTRQQTQMASASLMFEDRLDGASNLHPWREHINLVLEENGLLEIDEGKVVAPTDPITTRIPYQEICQG
jgi:hypothetical protein